MVFSCDAEAADAIPTEGDTWIEAQRIVDCPACGVLNQATTGGCRKDTRLVCCRRVQVAG